MGRYWTAFLGACSPVVGTNNRSFAILQPEVWSNPDVGLAEWTGLRLRKALRWRIDGKTYSASGLVKRILSQYVHDVDTLPGPRYWKLPDGDTSS